MTNWHCPECDGKFPSPTKLDTGALVCPWCSNPLPNGWEPDMMPSVTHVKKDD